MRTSSRWATLAVLCGALFITGLDNTIVNVALPSIQGDLEATTTELQWIVDAYSVTFAGFLLLSGSLGDRFGRRRLFVLGLLVFGVGSVLAALSQSGMQLALCRGLMGLGGAFVMPSTLSIIVATFPDRTERSRAIGIWAAVSGLGVAAGPLVGGLLLQHFTWHAVFWVNPPIAAVVIVAALALVPESRDPSRPRLDLVGAFLWALGLICLVVAIIEAPHLGDSSTTYVAGAAAALFLLAFGLWERRARRPILPLEVFADRTFRVSITLVALLYFALFGAMFFLPQFLQLVQDETPLESGLALLPGALGLVAASVMSSYVGGWIGPRRTVITGMSLVTLGLAAASWFTETSPAWYVSGSLVLIGVGMGLTSPFATQGVLGAVPPERAGIGSAVNETVGEVGGALGVAVLGALLSAAYAAHIDDAVRAAGQALDGVPASVVAAVRDSLSGASVAIPQLPEPLQEPARQVAGDAFVTGMTSSLWIGAIITAIGVLLAVLLFPRTLAEVEEG